MREILGRRRGFGPLHRKYSRALRSGTPEVRSAALTYADRWGWPVLPGAGTDAAGRCNCDRPGCRVPGGHPLDPELLAATADARMVGWWWTCRPAAPVLLATGGPAPCAVSFPASEGRRAMSALEACGVRVGPVVGGRDRWAVLVAPYALERLGELLWAKDRVPGSLRFHSGGGYLELPRSVPGNVEAARAGEEDRAAPGGVVAVLRGRGARPERRESPEGRESPERRESPEGRERPEGRAGVGWVRAPLPGSGTPWLPDVEPVVDVLVDTLIRAGAGTPDL